MRDAHLVAVEPEKVGERLCGVRVVIDHEDQAILLVQTVEVRPAGRLADVRKRQSDEELRAAADAVAASFDRSAVQLDESLHERGVRPRPPLVLASVCSAWANGANSARHHRGLDSDSAVPHAEFGASPFVRSENRDGAPCGVNFT